MTEKELMELVKKTYAHLYDVPRELITKKVIDNMEVSNSDCYHRALRNIDPNCISKEKALQLLEYDKEVYGLLTKELQRDEDILELTTENLEQLPEALFKSKDGINYILNKWNVDGKSWAVCEWDTKSLIIKRNINERKYIFYTYGIIERKENSRLSEEFLNEKFVSIEDETFLLSCEKSHYNTIITNPVKHLD